MTAKNRKAVRSKSKKTASKNKISVVGTTAGLWPQERLVMERPERYQYVRKMLKEAGCVFCNARESGVQVASLCVFKNEWAMLILNKYPYNAGHVMVIPTRHCANIGDLTELEHIETQKLLKKTVEVVQKIYKVEGINVGLNMGAIAGAGLPDHLHWHIVPRWLGDTNFFPLIAQTKIISETLAQTYGKYAQYFL